MLEFNQLDLDGSNIVYVHTSEVEDHADSFTFSVSDGVNDIVKTFHITITPVDDSIPLATIFGLKVQKGVRKLLTEFDLKVEDQDTKVRKLFGKY
mgnify:CR=1 FL=1